MNDGNGGTDKSNIYWTLGPTSVLYSSRRVKLAATANTIMRTQVARVMPQERCCWGLDTRGRLAWTLEIY